jgi:putative DNA primase/helicase
VNHTTIPTELKELPNWVCYRLEIREDKPTKVPYCPSGAKAKANDPSTWAGFDACLRAVKEGGFDGIGFQFARPYVGVDLDKCRSRITGRIEEWAQSIIARLHSYTEISPSGTGVHILLKGALPAGRRREGNVEVYDSGRYFTITGDHIEGTPLTLEDRTRELSELHAELFPHLQSELPNPRPVMNLADDEVLRKASAAANSSRFVGLWNGDWKSQGYSSRSEGDAALCSILAFWCGGNESRIDSLFRQSGLMRDKWNRDDYRLRTLTLAMSMTRESFTPKPVEAAKPALVPKNIPQLDNQDNLYDPMADYEMTDVGNGRRFVDKFKNQARYCPEEKIWYVWDGVRWNKDIENGIQELAKTIRADLVGWAKENPEKYKFANRAGMMERVSAMIRAASSDPDIVMHKAQFDAHDHLLNCRNGTVDLYTGELHPHDRNLFLSQLCPADYVPGFTHPVWTDVLAAVTRNHSDLAPFLQRFVGYVAQGNKGEELVVIFFGKGGTGKGTFLGTIEKTLGGDFVRNIAAASLLKQDRTGGGASGDIARLEGARLAIASEFDRNSRLNAGLVKLISGNDTMVARQLYEREREFPPQFQLVFQTNHRPKFDSADTGNQRRYIEVPFDNVVSKDPLVKVDTGLKKRLASDEEVHRAVLAWIVEGCVTWKANGLQIPECVRAATEALNRSNDVLNEFFTACLVLEERAMTTVTEMREEYKRYCSENGEDKLFTAQVFNSMLKDRGLEYGEKKLHGKVTKVWYGSRLRSEDEAERPFNPGLTRVK